MPIDVTHINELSNAGGSEYEKNNDIAEPRFGYLDAGDKAKIKGLFNSGDKNTSVINKLHIIKLAGDYPAMETDIPKHKDFFTPRTVTDLCKLSTIGQSYDIEDFLYCKHLGQPINRLITLRRFPLPCTDNIMDKTVQTEPDIARMVTYFNQEVNKLEDILSFSYRYKWKELEAEMEAANMYGDQSGVSGFIKNIGRIFDPTLNANALSGRSTGGPMSQYDPKVDQNRVYGPVDSITTTNIRNVGLEFDKDFEITFDYELRSINGRTAEYAFKDLLANVLACTYSNAKFWSGSRYWIGERPTNYRNKIQWMNSDNIDTILQEGTKWLKSSIQQWFGTKESALNTLKRALKGGFALAIGKILDSVGRPGILAMNSLLSAEPTGEWHLTIGNPVNPIMCIGNLILTGVEVKFPTDTLSYGDFPTKMQFIVRLKPGQPKDRAGIETMFNHGRQRIYFAPKQIKSGNASVVNRAGRNFSQYSNEEISRMTRDIYDFVDDKVSIVSETVITNKSKPESVETNAEPNKTNLSAMIKNSLL